VPPPLAERWLPSAHHISPAGRHIGFPGNFPCTVAHRSAAKLNLPTGLKLTYG
jgi:hypothetical protein